MESVKPGASQSHGVGGANAAPAKGLRFSQLSAPRQTLIRLCQRINFGSIESLCVEGAEPELNPPPLVLIDVKLDADELPRPEVDLPDFELCAEACRLITKLQELTTGIIERIEVRAGVPRRIVLRGSPPKPGSER